LAADVEWCAQGETLWLVQARPITALHLDRSLLPKETLSAWFFDQRFPDPITPFTQSTLLRLIGDVALGDALRMRGAGPSEELPHIYAGRAYTPLRIFETMLRGAPRWWLSADLRQIFGAAEQAPGNLLDTLHYAGCAAWTVCANAGDVFLNTRAWARFEQEAAQRLAELPNHAERWNELERIWADCDALSGRFLQIHRWSILWADYAYRVYQLLLRALPARAREYLESRLQAGIVLPTSQANALMAAWQAMPEDGLKAKLLRDYGDRSASLDSAVPTWAEMLEQAPATIPMQVEGTSTRAVDVVPPSRWSPLAVLARLLELRERQRFEWEHILAKQRLLALHAAEQLVARGLLASAAQVWMMTWEEFRAALRDGVAPDADALRLRQHELYLYWAVHPPARVSPMEEARPVASGNTLYGLGASPGVASGTAVLVRDPATQGPFPPGSILVLRALDPACSGIMRGAAGLVVERGGLLSHAAILAREYRVPLVIGVENVFQSVTNGERLHIDGSNGTVGRPA
jgi:phosphohistidine swiveling domain-containing protein